jgi:UPF0176 protein
MKVLTFYKFVVLHDVAALRETLEREAAQLSLKGTILLSTEGINGSVAGTESSVHEFSEQLLRYEPFAGMACRHSSAAPDNPVFYRLKVRLKPEIVTLGVAGIDPARRTGVHVDAARWNTLLADPDVVVIDTRNHYEVAIGTFPGARNPATQSFREFPDYVAANLDRQRHTKIAMFCTGGIRCEKASAYLLAEGFESVFQLAGGVLNYLQTVEQTDNRWQGECFVFDQRVSLDEQLAEGTYEQCYACRRPLDATALASADYLEGVSCPNCIDELDEDRKDGLRERQRQVELAAMRGQRHIGATGS